MNKKNTHSSKNIEVENIAITVQIIASLLSIGTIIISILLLYNQKLELKGKEPFFNARQAQNLSTFNRSLALIIFIALLIINFILYQISKEEGEELEPYILQIIASLLAVCTGIIGLYVVLRERQGEGLADVENPIF